MKCLVKKLNAVVDNDSLQTLNCLKATVKGSDSIQGFMTGAYIGFGNDVKIEYSKNAVLSNLSGTQVYANPYIMLENETWLSVGIKTKDASTDAELSIQPKYGIARLGLPANAVAHFTLEEISSLKHLVYLSLLNVQIGGDIENLKDMNNIKEVNLTSPDIYGDIKFLGRMISCTDFWFSNTSVSGRIEDMIESLSDNGKIAGQAYLRVQNTNVSLNRHTGIRNLMTVYFTEEGATIRFGSSSTGVILATFNKSSREWTYSDLQDL